MEFKDLAREALQELAGTEVDKTFFRELLLRFNRFYDKVLKNSHESESNIKKSVGALMGNATVNTKLIEGALNTLMTKHLEITPEEQRGAVANTG